MESLQNKRKQTYFLWKQIKISFSFQQVIQGPNSEALKYFSEANIWSAG